MTRSYRHTSNTTRKVRIHKQTFVVCIYWCLYVCKQHAWTGVEERGQHEPSNTTFEIWPQQERNADKSRNGWCRYEATSSREDFKHSGCWATRSTIKDSPTSMLMRQWKPDQTNAQPECLILLAWLSYEFDLTTSSLEGLKRQILAWVHIWFTFDITVFETKRAVLWWNLVQTNHDLKPLTNTVAMHSCDELLLGARAPGARKDGKPHTGICCCSVC